MTIIHSYLIQVPHEQIAISEEHLRMLQQRVLTGTLSDRDRFILSGLLSALIKDLNKK